MLKTIRLFLTEQNFEMSIAIIQHFCDQKIEQKKINVRVFSCVVEQRTVQDLFC